MTSYVTLKGSYSFLQYLLHQCHMVFLIGHCQKIYGAVIRFDAIKMMSHFSLTKWASQFLFQYQDMFRNITPLVSSGVVGLVKVNVASVHISPTLPTVSVFTNKTLFTTRDTLRSSLCAYEFSANSTRFFITLAKSWLCHSLIIVPKVFFFIFHTIYYTINICKCQTEGTRFENIQLSYGMRLDA